MKLHRISALLIMLQPRRVGSIEFAGAGLFLLLRRILYIWRGWHGVMCIARRGDDGPVRHGRRIDHASRARQVAGPDGRVRLVRWSIGWIAAGRSGWAIGPDRRSLLMADDVGNVIWRVTGA
jgi:hypothetical protein